MQDIGLCFSKGKRAKFVAYGNSLTQLSQGMQSKLLLQFRLSREDDLKEFFFCRFEVGKQPDIFQGIRLEVLCLINN